MKTLNQFKEARRLKAGKDSDIWDFGNGWIVEEVYPDNDTAGSVFVVCCEEFNSLNEATERLYQMYCDEEMLTGDLA